MDYTSVAVPSIMGGIEYINSAAGLRQDLMNVVNHLPGIVGGAKRRREIGLVGTTTGTA